MSTATCGAASSSPTVPFTSPSPVRSVVRPDGLGRQVLSAACSTAPGAVDTPRTARSLAGKAAPGRPTPLTDYAVPADEAQVWRIWEGNRASSADPRSRAVRTGSD